METIRSSWSIEGEPMFCEYNEAKKQFEVSSRWLNFFKTPDIYVALVIFDGLCMEDYPTKEHTKRLVHEARRNKRQRFSSNMGWHSRVIECALRRAEGLVPRICGSKGSVEKWIPAKAS
jgi:hypothetical protein